MSETITKWVWFHHWSDKWEATVSDDPTTGFSGAGPYRLEVPIPKELSEGEGVIEAEVSDEPMTKDPGRDVA